MENDAFFNVFEFFMLFRITLGMVFIYRNSSQVIADVLWGIPEGENDFRKTKDFIHR